MDYNNCITFLLPLWQCNFNILGNIQTILMKIKSLVLKVIIITFIN